MFNKLFKKNANQKDSWSCREAKNLDTGTVSIFLKNLSPRIKCGDKDFSYVSYLTFHYKKYSETGLPNSQDSSIFLEIEKNELLAFEKKQLAVHLASVTQEGVRDYIFQTCNPKKFLDLAEIIRNKYPKYDVDCEIIKDPEWSHYTSLPGN